MKIGILEAGHPPDSLRKNFGSYGEMFIALLDGYNFSFQLYDVENMKFPNSINEADGWLITGSKHGVYEAHQFIKPLEIFIQKIYAKNIPLVGICFGHQIIAQALGGKVEKFSGGWSIGKQDYKMFNQSDNISINAWHQDQIIQLPKDAEVIAENDFCKYAGIAYKKAALSFQGHPEYGHEFINGLVETRGKGVVPENLLKKAKLEMNTPLAQKIIADKMAVFFKQNKIGSNVKQ